MTYSYTLYFLIFFFSSRRRHTRFDCDWSSDVCSSDLRAHHDAHVRERARPLARVDLARVGRVQPLPRRGVDARAVPLLRPQDGRLRRLPLSGVPGRGRRGPYRSGLLAGAAPPSDRRGGRPDRARRRSGGRAPVADLSRGARLPRAHRQRMTATAIDARGLGKDFGAIRALGGLDLQLRQAEFFGLLGPNGAGKTTTVHLLATLLRPTRGTARVAG